MSGDTVVVVGREEAVTWKLPAENCALNARTNIGGCVETTTFREVFNHFRSTSISPGLNRIAIVGLQSNTMHSRAPSLKCVIYDRSTRRELVRLSTVDRGIPRFTKDGHQLWILRTDSLANGWRIVQDIRSGRGELEPMAPTVARPPGVFPWKSTRGYKVTDDGWVLSPTQKRLFWLPHHWRSAEQYRTWSGRFLGLLHELPEAVILEFIE